MNRFFRAIFGGSSRDDPSRRIFESIIVQSRLEPFYNKLGVPDTIDGRFELIVLHAFIVTNNLHPGHKLKRLSRDIMTHIFDNFDLSLREIGVGDMGMGRKIKVMADALYGSFTAYQVGFENGTKELEDALARNLYRGSNSSNYTGIMAKYVQNESQLISKMAKSELLEGKISFSSPFGETGDQNYDN